MGALYGVSIDTTSPQFAALTDDDAILQQWVDLQLRTAVGFYWDSPETGADIQGYVLQGLTPQQLAAVPSSIETGLADQRIASVDVTATPTYTAVGAVALALVIVVTPKSATAAPFTLTAVASAITAQITLQGLAA